MITCSIEDNDWVLVQRVQRTLSSTSNDASSAALRLRRLNSVSSKAAPSSFWPSVLPTSQAPFGVVSLLFGVLSEGWYVAIIRLQWTSKREQPLLLKVELLSVIQFSAVIRKKHIPTKRLTPKQKSKTHPAARSMPHHHGPPCFCPSYCGDRIGEVTRYSAALHHQVLARSHAGPQEHNEKNLLQFQYQRHPHWVSILVYETVLNATWAVVMNQCMMAL